MGDISASVQALRSWGLSPKEAKVYLSLLELGEATAARLSHATGFNRTTLYDLIASLSAKGLAGSLTKGAVLSFHAAHPDALMDVLRKKQNAVESVMSDLKGRMGIVGKRPSVEVYEGGRGLDAVYRDVLDAGVPILQYGSFAIVQMVDKYRSLNFRKQRIARAIPTTVITNDSIGRLPELGSGKYRGLTRILVNNHLKDVPTWTYIYGSKVAMTFFDKQHVFGIIIQSPAIVEKERHVFERLSKQSKALRM